MSNARKFCFGYLIGYSGMAVMMACTGAAGTSPVSLFPAVIVGIGLGCGAIATFGK